MENFIIGVIVFIGGLVFMASRKPDEFKVSRSIVINATVAAIFSNVNDLHKWEAWSPWAKLDPNAKNSFEGAEAGVGAKMSWAGNMKVGVGSMTITENRANEFIKFQLDFEKPMKATNIAEFLFTNEGRGTKVDWTMLGKNTLMGKVMNILMNCEAMVGNQFEQGLANLKSVAEKS